MLMMTEQIEDKPVSSFTMACPMKPNITSDVNLFSIECGQLIKGVKAQPTGVIVSIEKGGI
jgi:hypothetical protein